ncbi:hypothetical protein D3C75_1332030 [compost metagenome]
MYENVVRIAWVTGRRFKVRTGTLRCLTIAPIVLSAETTARDPSNGPWFTPASSKPAPSGATPGNATRADAPAAA